MPLIFDFINKYYIQPIYDESLGYNFVNSITYGLIAIVFLFLLYKWFEKERLKIDIKFFWALFPFVLLGSSTRVLVDKEILPTTFFTVSPGIYLLTAALFLLTLFASYFIEKKTKFDYWKISFIVGTILFIGGFIFYGRNLKFINLNFGFYIIGLTILIFVITNILLKKIWTWFDKISSLPLFAHLLDASATFMAVDFLGFTEKHPLPTLATQLAGTAAIMYLLKLAVLIPAIYFIKKDLKQENLQNYLLIAIAVLGFAQGIRDLLTVIF